VEVDVQNGEHSVLLLQATRDILAGEEILWNYGQEYDMGGTHHRTYAVEPQPPWPHAVPHEVTRTMLAFHMAVIRAESTRQGSVHANLSSVPFPDEVVGSRDIYDDHLNQQLARLPRDCDVHNTPLAPNSFIDGQRVQQLLVPRVDLTGDVVVIDLT
jgi:hypothetical protein